MELGLPSKIIQYFPTEKMTLCLHQVIVFLYKGKNVYGRITRFIKTDDIVVYSSIDGTRKEIFIKPFEIVAFTG